MDKKHDRINIKGETFVLLPENDYLELIKAQAGKAVPIAELIRDALVKYGTSAAEFARLAKTTPAQIVRLEKGAQKANPRTEFKIKAAVQVLAEKYKQVSSDQKLSD